MTQAATTRGEQTRQAILDAAENLFLTQGYSGTSMRQIARRAGGIAVGGIYNHFGAKEDIFQALIEARSPIETLAAAFESLEGDSGPELLRRGFTRLQAIMNQYLSFVVLAIIDFQEFDGQTIRRLAGDVVPGIMIYGQRVIAKGGLRNDLDAFQILRAFINMVIGYTFTQVIAYQGDQPRLTGIPDVTDKEAQTFMMDILLNGMADNDGAV